jgi:rsbT co-antagonist protein RsbR
MTIVTTELRPSDQEALLGFWEVYDASYDTISEEITAVLADHPEFGPMLKTMPPEQARARQEESRERLRRAIVDGNWDEYFDQLLHDAVTYARAGISFSSWMSVLAAFREPLHRRLFERYGTDPDRLRTIVAAEEELLGRAMGVMADAYLEEKERVIAEQQEAIKELTTPVLTLRPALLLLPLIGVVDSDRARQITEQLLDAVARERARVVVIDVTGVPTVDSMVANHLMQTTQAARLMGATVFVTGISTETAQTLVRIGVDPSKLHTSGDLSSGIAEAEVVLARFEGSLT